MITFGKFVLPSLGPSDLKHAVYGPIIASHVKLRKVNITVVFTYELCINLNFVFIM